MHDFGLHIGGITPLTTIDYPGELAAVIFCQGCPWKCRYCHNKHLLPSVDHGQYDWQAIIKQLEQRIGFLDAVVFSGGEPTLQSGLLKAIGEIRSMGFKIGLHTAGCYPKRLKKLLPYLDWVGLDIKALIDDYPSVTGVVGSGNKAWESLKIIQETDVDFEVRITIHNNLISFERASELLEKLSKGKISKLVFQQCQTGNMFDDHLGNVQSGWEISDLLFIAHRYFKSVEMRG